MKAFQQASTGQQLKGSVSFLSDQAPGKCTIGADCDMDSLVAAYKTQSC